MLGQLLEDLRRPWGGGKDGRTRRGGMEGERIEEVCWHRGRKKDETYHLVLIRVLAGAAGARPDTLCCLNPSTAPSPHWSCTRRTPRRSCLIGRWSRRGRGSWTGSQDAPAAWCEATQWFYLSAAALYSAWGWESHITQWAERNADSPIEATNNYYINSHVLYEQN